MTLLGVKSCRKPKRADGLRRCEHCGLAKRPDEFVRIKACREGWYGRCRVCRNRRARERYHSTPEIRTAEIARASRNGKLRRERQRAESAIR